MGCVAVDGGSDLGAAGYADAVVRLRAAAGAAPGAAVGRGTAQVDLDVADAVRAVKAVLTRAIHSQATHVRATHSEAADQADYRQAAHSEATQPRPGEDGVGAEHDVVDLLAALAVLRHVRDELSEWEPLLITAARSRGASWASLAPALGVTSRQAAERRYLRLQPSATGESTGEERVRAERTRRAGDRAVARWARQNSAWLRQLAGQISGLTDLAPSARARADVVRRALADDDPAALLSPLADARSHLPARHAALADRIRTVTEHTERVRRDTADHRAEDRR